MSDSDPKDQPELEVAEQVEQVEQDSELAVLPILAS